MRRLLVLIVQKQIALLISVGTTVFLAVYLGWALNTTSVLYSHAIVRSEQAAHTIVGQEGYEYIFDPTTQILIDRIKPNGSAIVSYLVMKNFLPQLNGRDCTYPDAEACHWISMNLHFDDVRRNNLWKMLLFSSFLGLIAAGGYYFLTEHSSFR